MAEVVLEASNLPAISMLPTLSATSVALAASITRRVYSTEDPVVMARVATTMEAIPAMVQRAVAAAMALTVNQFTETLMITMVRRLVTDLKRRAQAHTTPLLQNTEDMVPPLTVRNLLPTAAAPVLTLNILDTPEADIE